MLNHASLIMFTFHLVIIHKLIWYITTVLVLLCCVFFNQIWSTGLQCVRSASLWMLDSYDLKLYFSFLKFILFCMKRCYYLIIYRKCKILQMPDLMIHSKRRHWNMGQGSSGHKCGSHAGDINGSYLIVWKLRCQSAIPHKVEIFVLYNSWQFFLFLKYTLGSF